jgi:hypothetical protein
MGEPLGVGLLNFARAVVFLAGRKTLMLSLLKLPLGRTDDGCGQTMTDIDVAIDGRRSYGLAASAYVARLGLSRAVIGERMWFWRRSMPCRARKLGLACKSNVL